MSKFWKVSHSLTGVKLKMSTAYHPQTDGVLEHTNKMVNQALHYHVASTQKGWVRVLPRMQFDHMNTINKLTGFSPFQLWLGHSPCLIPPPVVPVGPIAPEKDQARALIAQLELDVQEAQDNLLKNYSSCICQLHSRRWTTAWHWWQGYAVYREPSSTIHSKRTKVHG